MDPERSSKINVRTAVEPVILPAERKLKLSIPAGIDNGQSVRIREKGEPGVNGGPRGDLLVEVIVSSSSDLPASGYEYLFNCTDFVCAGSVGRRDQESAP